MSGSHHTVSDYHSLSQDRRLKRYLNQLIGQKEKKFGFVALGWPK
jgi:hypothetical protein